MIYCYLKRFLGIKKKTSCFEAESVRSDVLEVTGPAVFFGEERCAVVEFTGCAAGAFGRIGAVEVGNMTVSNIAEPISSSRVS